MRAHLLLPIVIVSSLFSSTGHVAAQSHTVLITRLFTAPDGHTHAVDAPVTFRPDPQQDGLDRSLPIRVRIDEDARFIRGPRGFVWPWHPTVARQYVITISGRGEVEIAGGQKVPLAPGRILFEEDVTGPGHTTRVVGADDLVLLELVSRLD